MPIASLKDINDAYDEGRVHTQRFFKNASTSGDLQWIDWAFASGQPAYDARIGTGLSFNPFIASRNDAVFFPSIPGTMERRLKDVNLRTLASGTNQVVCSCVLYDLLGVYPLIDGDSTDEQFLDSTQPLPRYATGDGVLAVLVNHVSPMIGACNGLMTYTDSDNNDKIVDIRVALTGQNKVVTAIPTNGALGAINIPLGTGSKGVKRINSITFTTTPGGLYAIYLIKIITTINNCDGNAVSQKVWTGKDMCLHNAWNMPRIYDGAHLGFFIMPNGSGRTVSMFGDMTFVWG